MKLKTKLQVGFVALAMITTLIGITAIWVSYFFHHTFENVLHIDLPLARDTVEFEAKVLKITPLGGELFPERIKMLRDLWSQEVEHLRRLRHDAQLVNVYQSMEGYFEQYEKISLKVLDLERKVTDLEQLSHMQFQKLKLPLAEYLKGGRTPSESQAELCLEYINTIEQLAEQKQSLLALGDKFDSLGQRIRIEAEAGQEMAWQRLDKIHQKADRVTSRIKWFFFPFIFFAIGLAWLMGASASTYIFGPISSLISVFTAISGGDINQRIKVESKDEIKTLAEAANTMADHLERRILDQQQMLELTRIMGSSIELDRLLNHLLDNLLNLFHCQLGAFYLVDQSGDWLQLKAAKGAGSALFAQYDLKIGEGLIGSVAQSKRMQVLADIPKETGFTIKSILGESLPNQMVLLPFYLQDNLLGVLALAGFYPLAEDRLKILEIVAGQLGLAIANAKSYHLVRHQAEELQTKGEELEVQNEELRSQSEELETQTEELSAQQKELEAKNYQIQEASRLKTEFLANMSHELRTPLNSILSFSHLLLDHVPGELNEEQEKQIRIIAKNGKNLLQLINDLLDLSRIESGRIEIDLQPLLVDELIAEIKDGIEPMVLEKGLTLKIQVDSNLPIMRFDRRRLNQILLNLLNNALKFTQKGEISLRVEAMADRKAIQFTVQDTGIGIAPSDLKVIFQEFRQIDGSLTRTYSGAGLGLAIVQRLVRSLKGKVMVESEPGQGSCFMVILPVNPDEYGLDEKFIPEEQSIINSPFSNGLNQRGLFNSATGYAIPISSLPKSPQPSNPKVGKKALLGKILVLEPDAATAHSLSLVLKSEDYVLNWARDRETAWQTIVGEKPDLIIMDLGVQAKEVFALIEKMRKQYALVKPIIILSDRDLTEDEQRQLPKKGLKIIRKGLLKKETLLKEIQDMLVSSISPQRLVAVDKVEVKAAEPESKSNDKAIAEQGGWSTKESKEGRLWANKKKILIVEDNLDNLYAGICALEKAGYITVEAKNGFEAMEKAEQEQPDLILMDIQLPGLDGFEVIRRLSEKPALSSIPIIALTAYAMPNDQEKALQSGCIDYLAKPCLPEELVNMVQRYL